MSSSQLQFKNVFITCKVLVAMGTLVLHTTVKRRQIDS